MARRRKPHEIILALRTSLIEMGDTLQEVSVQALEERGGWDRQLFEDVLNRVERQTPIFQGLLVDFLIESGNQSADRITALLAVDRLSAAYTYWTRLFPPRQTDQAIFVLSLLHDLSDKVEYAISLFLDEES